MYLEALEAGEAGNDIDISTTSAALTPSASTLLGGQDAVEGTPGSPGEKAVSEASGGLFYVTGPNQWAEVPGEVVP